MSDVEPEPEIAHILCADLVSERPIVSTCDVVREAGITVITLDKRAILALADAQVRADAKDQ